MSSNQICDIAIVGCGPAGLSAAVNARARNKNAMILGERFCSPKLFSSPKVDNYLGLPGIKGADLRNLFLTHVEKMDFDISRSRVEAVSREDDGFLLVCGNGEAIEAKSIVLAVGVSQPDILPGEEEFVGRGVSYCATCDAMFFKGKRVAVLAFDPEGEDEAKFLAEICSEVYYIRRYEGETGFLGDNIKIVQADPTGIGGDKTVEFLELGREKLPVQGIFIVRQSVPVDQLVPGVEMSGHFIRVGLNMETNIPGVFAAGDCAGKPFQLAKAVGQGQVAALSAANYLQ